MLGSKPPTWSHTSRRTSSPALPTASTSRSPSCCPWSTSRASIPVTRRPTRSMPIPTSSRTSRSDQSMTFGPSTAAVGTSSAPSSSRSSASGSGSQSSWSSHTHSVRSRGGTVARVAIHAEHGGAAQRPGEHRPAAVPAAGIDADHTLHGPGLVHQGFGGARNPRGPIMGDDDRGDDVLGLQVIRRHGSTCCSKWSPAGRPDGLRPVSGVVGASREQYAKPWRAVRKTARPRPGIPQDPPGGSEGSALDPAPFPFRQPAPDPEPLVVLERVLQALGPHLTAAAHLLGFPGRAALLGEERLRIGLCAQRTVLPVLAPGIVLADTKYPERDDLSHGAPPTLQNPVGTRRTPGASAQTTQVKLHSRVLRRVKRDA